MKNIETKSLIYCNSWAEKTMIRSDKQMQNFIMIGSALGKKLILWDL
jgi:hypothetical protein